MMHRLPSPESVLNQAQRIVIDQEITEIDWAENPLHERERVLRLGIIRQIEKTVDQTWMPLFADSDDNRAFYTLSMLNELVPKGKSVVVGRDLFNAIHRWQTALTHEQLNNARKRHGRMLDRVRREVNGQA